MVSGDHGAHAGEHNTPACCFGSCHTLKEVLCIVLRRLLGDIMIQLVHAGALCTLLVQQWANKLEGGLLRLVPVCNRGRDRILQLLRSRHKVQFRPGEAVQVPEQLLEHDFWGHQLHTSVRCNRLHGLFVRLEALNGINDLVHRLALHLQELIHCTHQAPRPCRGQQGDAGDAHDLRPQRRLPVDQRAVDHGRRLQVAQESHDSGNLHLQLHAAQLEMRCEALVVRHAVLLLQGLNGTADVRLASLVELRQLLNVRVEHGTGALDGLTHLLTAEVVHLVA
mmetsp:Transcript_10827/g.27919  ORF Transcript_10827/g.27919 Transcript_10827/m.27919 type:complete len:280 (+) Transcript_10827:446-1285(+)